MNGRLDALRDKIDGVGGDINKLIEDVSARIDVSGERVTETRTELTAQLGIRTDNRPDGGHAQGPHHHGSDREAPSALVRPFASQPGDAPRARPQASHTQPRMSRMPSLNGQRHAPTVQRLPLDYLSKLRNLWGRWSTARVVRFRFRRRRRSRSVLAASGLRVSGRHC